MPEIKKINDGLNNLKDYMDKKNSLSANDSEKKLLLYIYNQLSEEINRKDNVIKSAAESREYFEILKKNLKNKDDEINKLKEELIYKNKLIAEFKNNGVLLSVTFLELSKKFTLEEIAKQFTVSQLKDKFKASEILEVCDKDNKLKENLRQLGFDTFKDYPDLRRRADYENEESGQEIIKIYNSISIKNNRDDRLSHFKLSSSFEKIEVDQEKPAYWLIYERHNKNNSYFIFPNIMTISESNYADTYQDAYDIKNFMYAGQRGRYLILNSACVVENGRIIKRGEGHIE